jgi:excisionase family DNA binding protein
MDKQAEPTPLLTPREAAKLLNLPTKTVRRMIQSKELPALKVGRRWRIPRLHVTAAQVRSRRLG